MSNKFLFQETAIADIHRTRERIHDAFAGNIQAILDDARQSQEQSGRPKWAPGAKKRDLQRRGQGESPNGVK